MAKIMHRVGIRSPIESVYRALGTTTGIANWWTNDTNGISEIGHCIGVRFSDLNGKILGSMELRVLALSPNDRVEWQVLSGPDEWIGTIVSFTLKSEGDYTIVLFKHDFWRDEVEFMAHCSTKWAVFLLSLKQYLESGSGAPSPHDVKIDNWN